MHEDMNMLTENREILDGKAGKSREKVEKWKWRLIGLTKIMGAKFIVSLRLF